MEDLFKVEETADLLGCSIGYSYYAYNICDGWYCTRDWQCASGNCCRSYCEDWCGDDLAWLWWTLFCIFLFLCILSCILKAKRRQRMARMAAMSRNANNNSDTAAIVVTTQP